MSNMNICAVIEGSSYTGTPVEIMENLMEKGFLAGEVIGVEEYMDFIAENIRRLAGKRCITDKRHGNAKAMAILNALADAGAIEAMEVVSDE